MAGEVNVYKAYRKVETQREGRVVGAGVRQTTTALVLETMGAEGGFDEGVV